RLHALLGWFPILLVAWVILARSLLSGPSFRLGAQELILLLIILVLLFGRKLPELGRYLGKGIVEFRKGIRGVEDEIDPSSQGLPDEEPHSLTHRATVRYYSRMNPERVYP